MCNDTEASLEADWEGYKSIWLSLNSPLLLTANNEKSNCIPYTSSSTCPKNYCCLCKTTTGCMVTTIASRNSYSERRFLKRNWQIISYRICTMNCLISPLWLCLSDSKVKNRTAIVYLEASICNVIASAFPSFNRIV